MARYNFKLSKMWVYILTFVLGLYVDQLSPKKCKNIRILFIGWLFIFLCFSYTNGSDWRSYELGYEEGYLTYALMLQDLGFVALMNFFRLIFEDFWITLGLLKCIYLYSCIRILQKFTSHWITSLVMMLPLSLMFMLIDNPLRFMVAMIFVNFAMLQLIGSKYIYTIILSLFALSCHSVSLLCIMLIPFVKYDLISKYKSTTLIVMYIFILLLSSSLDNMLQLQRLTANILANYLGREGLGEHYEMENTESLFTLGTLINFILFCIILKNKKLLITIDKKIFSSSVLYFYIFNISHVFPGGHRIRIILTFFCCISYAIIMFKAKMYRIILVPLFCGMLMKNIWVTYSYIPYTNSIPYIVTSHKSYSERFELNLINYKKRTGREHFIE